MYEKYFDQYYISERELIEKIRRTLTLLADFSPEVWSHEWLDYANPDSPAEDAIRALTTNIPSLSQIKLDFDKLSIEENLRILAIALDSTLDGLHLDFLFPRTLIKHSVPYFLAVRYALASEILEERLGVKLKYDREKILDFLYTKAYIPENTAECLFVSKLAHQEIDRLYESVEGTEYARLIQQYEAEVESYIRNNYVKVFYEAFMAVCTEGVAKCSNIINDQILVDQRMTEGDIKELVDLFNKRSRESAMARLGIETGWGGKRKRQTFTWTDENKLAFYQQIEAISKITIKVDGTQKMIDIWEDLYKQFQYRGEDAVRLLADKDPYNTAPPSLIQEAFAKWKSYEERYASIKECDCPKMFLYRDALHKLQFPESYFNQRENRDILYKYSTLNKHYHAGKALAEHWERSSFDLNVPRDGEKENGQV